MDRPGSVHACDAELAWVSGLLKLVGMYLCITGVVTKSIKIHIVLTFTLHHPPCEL